VPSYQAHVNYRGSARAKPWLSQALKWIVDNNKKLRKQIQGELDVINEHLDKIAEELKKPRRDRYAIEKWA
jgi:hypothetical protein